MTTFRENLRLRYPKRDATELIEALRIRAMYLTGEKWERTATAAMMKEAADMLESMSSPTKADR